MRWVYLRSSVHMKDPKWGVEKVVVVVGLGMHVMDSTYSKVTGCLNIVVSLIHTAFSQLLPRLFTPYLVSLSLGTSSTSLMSKGTFLQFQISDLSNKHIQMRRCVWMIIISNMSGFTEGFHWGEQHQWDMSLTT